MVSIQAILDKVSKSKQKTDKIRALKKEKMKAKKEQGDFIPKGEFKKQKDIQKKAKLVKKQLNLLKNKEQKEDQKDVEVKEIKKKIVKKKQNTTSFKSYDQYERKAKREEYKNLKKENEPFKSYGVEKNMMRREQVNNVNDVRKFSKSPMEGDKGRERKVRNDSKNNNFSQKKQVLFNPDGTRMNRSQRRAHLRQAYNQKNGIEEKEPRHPKRSFGGRTGGNRDFDNRRAGGNRDFDNRRAGGNGRFEKREPKEWKAGSGSNAWGMDNMHPSWAAKRNMETQELSAFSKGGVSNAKVIEL